MSAEKKMNYEEFMENLMGTDDWNCSCHLNAPCYFCTDEIQERYDDYLEELGKEESE